MHTYTPYRERSGGNWLDRDYSWGCSGLEYLLEFLRGCIYWSLWDAVWSRVLFYFGTPTSESLYSYVKTCYFIWRKSHEQNVDVNVSMHHVSASSHIISMTISDKMPRLYPSAYTDHPIITETRFTSLRAVHKTVNSTYTALEDPNNPSAIQYITIHNIPEATAKKINDDSEIFGVPFRFTYYHDSKIGVIKVQPPISDQVKLLGVKDEEIIEGASRTHKTLLENNTKQPDVYIAPLDRPLQYGQTMPWSSLVIETALSESITPLNKDANWWFSSFSGTNVVFTMSLKRTQPKSVLIQKWQKVLVERPGLHGPRPTIWVRPTQSITVTADSVEGGPLVLSLWALMCPSSEDTKNITIPDEKLIRCFSDFW